LCGYGQKCIEGNARFSDGNAIGKEEKNMLWTIAVVLFVLWALGLVSAYTMGGFVHVLLVLALVVVVINVLQGRRALG
jgi:hypothetical protein